MAEPIGLAASLATLGGVANGLFRFSRVLYDAARHGGQISDEMRYFASHVRITGDSFKIALMTLTKVNEQSELSDIYQYLKSQRTLKDVQRNIKYLSQGLEGIYPLLATVTDTGSLWSKFKWLYRQRTHLTELIHKMSCLQSSVDIILHAVLVERNNLDASGTQDQTFLLRLKDDK